MSGDEEQTGVGSPAEQIGNDAVQYTKPNWILIAGLTIATVGAVVLQVVGLVLEGKWKSTLYFWQVGFDPELWSKAGGIALAGIAAILSVAKASIAIYATYRQTNIKHENHYHTAPQLPSGIEKVEAALGQLPKLDDLRAMMLEHVDATKLQRVEVDREDLRTLLQHQDMIKEFAATGALQRIQVLEADAARLHQEREAAQTSWDNERSSLQGLAATREQSIQELTNLKTTLERQLAMASAASTTAAAESAQLKRELEAAKNVLKVGETFMTDWSSVTTKGAQFADAMGQWKSRA